MLLANDAKLRETMGQKARETVRQKFLLTRYLEQDIDLLDSFTADFKLSETMKAYE